MSNFLKDENGFSLLEMSLVLAIMGTVAGLSLPLLIERQEQQKARTTQERLQTIKAAAGIYAARHHKLPCPSIRQDSGIASHCSVSDLSSGKGYVPFKTLGLSKKASLDAYGHPLHYAIDINASQGQYNFDAPLKSTLHVENLDGKSLLDPNNTKETLALVVFSEGTGYAKPQSIAEQRNTAATLNFIDAPFSQRQDASFRHMVSWSTFSHLIVIHGKGSLPQPKSQLHSTLQSTLQTGSSPVSTPSTVTTSSPPSNSTSFFDNNDPGF